MKIEIINEIKGGERRVTNVGGMKLCKRENPGKNSKDHQIAYYNLLPGETETLTRE